VNSEIMNRKILLISLALCLSLGVSAQAQRRGVPATPHPIEHIQPNGDTLVYRLHGDEHRHWQTTLDGYLIKKNRHDKFCYAKLSRKGAIKATCRTAHNAEDRSECEAKYVRKHIPQNYIPTRK